MTSERSGISLFKLKAKILHFKELPGKFSCPCIIIDTYRASSTIVTLLEKGLEKVIIGKEIEDVRSLKEEHLKKGINPITIGEKKCVKPKGFDFDNSPSAIFSSKEIKGVGMLTSSNGALAISKAMEGSTEVFIGSVLNAQALANFIKKLGSEEVILLPIGILRYDLNAIEDELCAEFIKALLEEKPHPEKIVEGLADKILSQRKELSERLNKNFPTIKADADFVSQVDRFKTVPKVYKENGICCVKGIL